MRGRDCIKSIRVLAVGMSILAVGSGAALAAAPAKVGEPEPLAIGSPHPYPVGTGVDAMEWVVRYPQATYIRIHFSQFELAPGDWLQISDPAGTRVGTYEGRGPHDTGEFWAHTVPGDTAIVRLEATVGGQYGFESDTFGRGITPIFLGPSEPESVCGTQDWQDVACYASSRPAEYERATGAVKALIGCCSSCTAFKVSDSGQFMTNNHCTTTPSDTELLLRFEKPGCNSGTGTSTGSVFGSQSLGTDYTLDYTLFTTIGDSSSIPCLEIDARLAPEGERIYIAGHPAGEPKKLSIESDLNGGDCVVDNSPHPGRDSTSDIGYYCDTTGGSSGSPVLSGDTNKVVAIHHYGGCLNSGVRMDRIWGQISGLIDSCAGAEPPVCGNGVKEAGEDCDGSDLGGETCQSLGYDDGVLVCDQFCSFDESGCFDNPCLPKRASCTSDDQCCSGKCRGKGGDKACK